MIVGNLFREIAMNRLTRNARRLCATLLAALAGPCLAEPLPPLPALNIDIAETSVSGISSGGFMAVQFQVAHSATVKGAGIVAAGPWYCARNDAVTATTRCSCTGEPVLRCEVTATSTEVPELVARAREQGNAGAIDDPANLAGHRVVMLSGEKDALVPKEITTQLKAFYAALGVPDSNLVSHPLANAGHTMPTTNFGVACPLTDTPYIGKCGFDGAKALLKGIYPDMHGPASSKAKGQYIRFDQKPYVPADWPYSYLWNTGLDSSGWLYVPKSCARGERCRLHVALHGCKQGQSYLPLHPPPGGGLYYGTTFVRNTGYDRWADNNHLVILFPQAVSIPGANPNGCWDWWGYTDGHFADRQGVQIRALRAMVEQLASGRR